MQIRLVLSRRIDRRRGPSPWRPDSTTGVTRSQNHNDLVKKAGTGQIENTRDLYHAKPVFATAHTSGGPSPRLSSSVEGREALGDQISCVLEEQEETDQDSESDGGVLLI